MVILIGMSASAYAGTCEIRQTICPNNTWAVGTFEDIWGEQNVGAAQNPAECMRRASNYYQWCGGAALMNGTTTTATYLVGSIAQQTVTVGGANASNRVCQATNSATYLSCINAVQTNQADSIVINGMISCIGPMACEGVLTNINRAITVSGADGQSGFYRPYGHHYTVLSISNIPSVAVSRLIFDDVTSQEYIDGTQSLPSTFMIGNCQNVTINGVTVAHSSSQVSVSINTVANLNFINSTVTDGGAMGLWLNNIDALEINNSVFSLNRSNGVFIASQGPSNSTIENSQFNHNHRMAVYDSCDGPCGGGQLDIVTEWNLTIKNNHIWNGNAAGVLVGGIELNNPTHLTIENNDIESNTGSAIYSNVGTPVQTNILNNTFNNNLSAFYNLTGVYSSGNGPQQ